MQSNKFQIGERKSGLQNIVKKKQKNGELKDFLAGLRCSRD